MEASRPLVYANRIAMLMRRLSTVMKQTRSMAYASELGESTRPVVNPMFVRFLYGISWGYVILDTTVKVYSVKDQGSEKMKFCALDTAIWHTFASMALPAFTIHAIVKYADKFIKKKVTPTSYLGRFGATVIGLASIPFIIHPLDHLTDFVMDNTLRKVYADKLPHLPKEH